MSSGFPGGVPDFFSGGRTQQQQFSFRTPTVPDPCARIRRPDSIGKRSLAEFQQQGQGLGFYLRNMKPRLSNNINYYYQQHASPISTLSPVDFPPVPSAEFSSNTARYGLPMVPQQHQGVKTNINSGQRIAMSSNSGLDDSARDQSEKNILTLSPVDFPPVPSGSAEFSSNNPRYRLPMVPQHPGVKTNINSGQRITINSNSGLDDSARDQSEKNILQELEKQLLGDEDEESEPVSEITNSEWSDTIQNLIGPARNPTSLSPTSSSSSCSSTSASPPLVSTKQALIDAAEAISDGKPDAAVEFLTRLHPQAANPRGTSEQRLAACMADALRRRVSSTHSPSATSELNGIDHASSTQMLYDVSPCFKLGFMAANLAILEAAAERGFEKIHVVDFDVGQGGQYVHLLHALSKARDGASLTVTAFANSRAAEGDRLRIVREGLEALANKVGVCLTFNEVDPNTMELTRENLRIRPGEALAVNFAFKLYKLPDESVTTENLRDEMLRRVKGLSPVVMTVVEQEMNTNTANLATRVRDAWEYYGLLFDSLDSTVSRESPERVRIEVGLGRRIGNAVGCEGADRVERCEVYGKWRARMSMAGFQLRAMSKGTVESLRAKVNSGPRGNPGFSVNEESGGIGFGWMGRNLTVASAWR